MLRLIESYIIVCDGLTSHVDIIYCKTVAMSMESGKRLEGDTYFFNRLSATNLWKNPIERCDSRRDRAFFISYRQARLYYFFA